MARRAATIGTIAAVAVLVLVVVGGVAGLLRPYATGGPRGSAGAADVAVPIAAAGPAAPAASGTPAPGRPIPQAGDTQVKPEAAARAVCAVAPAELTGLTEITAHQKVESLRDAIPLLQERLDQVGSAAVGRPVLKPVEARLERINTFWEQAVAASDAQRPAAVKQALASANAQIKTLAAELRTAYPASGSDC